MAGRFAGSKGFPRAGDWGLSPGRRIIANESGILLVRTTIHVAGPPSGSLHRGGIQFARGEALVSRLTSFVLLLTSGFVVAQQPRGDLPEASPQFDVTSVKRSGSDKMAIGMSTYPRGRVVCTVCSARYLLMEAFQIQAWHVEGLPAWTDEKGGERYDMEGKPAEDSPASKLNPAMSNLPPNENQRQMLQAMLVDRFQLKYHWRSKEAQVYFLERGHDRSTCRTQRIRTHFRGLGSLAGRVGAVWQGRIFPCRS
jgi:hypothetical protein